MNLQCNAQRKLLKMPKKKKLKKKKKIFKTIEELIDWLRGPWREPEPLPDDPAELGKVLAKQSIEKFKKELQKLK